MLTQNEFYVANRIPFGHSNIQFYNNYYFSELKINVQRVKY